MKWVRFALLLIFLAPRAEALETAWKPSQLVQTSALARVLKTKDEPLNLHVGFQFLYKSGHIPGSKYLGPAKDEAGLKKLRDFAKPLPRDRQIVLYCGCCPFEKCPNVGPAFRALEAMGFKNVRVLELRENFATDWSKKGFPIER